MKQTIQLTEAQLCKLVENIIKEYQNDDEFDDNALIFDDNTPQIDRDAIQNYWDMVDQGVDMGDEDIEKEASWDALRQSTPTMSRKERSEIDQRLCDRRIGAKQWVNGELDEAVTRAIRRYVR